MCNADLTFFTHRVVLDIQNIIRFAMNPWDTDGIFPENDFGKSAFDVFLKLSPVWQNFSCIMATFRSSYTMREKNSKEDIYKHAKENRYP